MVVEVRNLDPSWDMREKYNHKKNILPSKPSGAIWSGLGPGVGRARASWHARLSAAGALG